ncbi:MAG: HTH-type transcriptional activator mta [Candidatus Anoxychlamydiales bacterium]|nr:HTH-type transcriptional activator mta [Candidatus Anoxychlamydiales bacterium]
MAYTVKKLAKISGVTERTLRWYDKIGLLKPSYIGSNGYRFYEEEELLLLQQILFYRELDFPLNEIKEIILKKDFNKVTTLLIHKKSLEKSLERTKKLIKTIDDTILHIRGKKFMKDNELYKGFYEWTEGKGPEKYYLGKCENIEKIQNENEKIVLKSSKNLKNENLDKSYFDNLEKTYSKIYQDITKCIDKDLTTTSQEAQDLIKTHYEFASKFLNLNKKVYISLSNVYLEKDEFKKQLDDFHPKLAYFISDAMKYFAEKNL